VKKRVSSYLKKNKNIDWAAVKKLLCAGAPAIDRACFHAAQGNFVKHSDKQWLMPESRLFSGVVAVFYCF